MIDGVVRKHGEQAGETLEPVGSLEDLPAGANDRSTLVLGRGGPLAGLAVSAAGGFVHPAADLPERRRGVGRPLPLEIRQDQSPVDVEHLAQPRHEIRVRRAPAQLQQIGLRRRLVGWLRARFRGYHD